MVTQFDHGLLYYDLMQIAVCEMVRTRNGGMKKNSDYVEVVLSSMDSHSSTVSKSCRELGQEFDPNKPPMLVRISGCKIPDHSLIDTDGESAPWTIGRYLKQTFSSRSSIKLGLVFEEVSCETMTDCVSSANVTACRSWFWQFALIFYYYQHFVTMPLHLILIPLYGKANVN